MCCFVLVVFVCFLLLLFVECSSCFCYNMHLYKGSEGESLRYFGMSGVLLAWVLWAPLVPLQGEQKNKGNEQQQN